MFSKIFPISTIVVLFFLFNGIYNRTIRIEGGDQRKHSVIFFRIYQDNLKLYNRNETVASILLEYNYNLESPYWTGENVEFAELFSSNFRFQRQPKTGVKYSTEEHYTFKLNINAADVHFRFRVTTTETFKTYYGSVFPLRELDEPTSGYRNVTLIDRCMNINGTLRVEYLLVKPVQFPLSTVNIQTKISDPLEGIQWAGHRGTGSGIRTDLTPKIYENTLTSFNYVCGNGAQMVELDVHLSRDLIPIIYHDFTRKIYAQSINNTSITVEGNVKDYTLSELQSMIVPGAESFKLFETFESILRNMHDDCGINVEIKYPQQFKNKQMEAELPVDINLFVDRILEVLLAHTRSGQIIISSFSADVCTLAKLKQSRIPVYFLTSGDLENFPSLPWDPYWDLRTRTVAANIAFARSLDFSGLSLYSDHLYEVSMEDIKKIRGAGLSLAVWGSSVDTKPKALDLLRKGVNNLILDKVDLIHSEK